MDNVYMIDKQLWYRLMMDYTVFSERDKEAVVLIYMLNNDDGFKKLNFVNMLNSASFDNNMAVLAEKVENYINMREPEKAITGIRWWNLICNGIREEDSFFRWTLRNELNDAIEQLIDENIIDINSYKNNKEYFYWKETYPRNDINYMISVFERSFVDEDVDNSQSIKETMNLNGKMSAEDIVSSPIMKSRMLYDNFADKIIPVYYSEYLLNALVFFEASVDPVRRDDGVYLYNLLMAYKENNPVFYGWSYYKFMSFVFKMIIITEKHYKIFIGNSLEYWKECFNNNYVRIGWDDIGDISKYKDFIEFKDKFIEMYPYYSSKEAVKNVNELWTFYSLRKGDSIVAVKDSKTILCIGDVNERCYRYEGESGFFKHIIGVDWKKDFIQKKIEAEDNFEESTIESISEKLYEEIIKGYEETSDIIRSTIEIDSESESDYMSFFDAMKRCLERKRNVIIYGGPETGKTYKVNKFLEYNSKKRGNIVYKKCSFNISYGYEDFIEGYRKKDGSYSSEIHNGVFKEICIEAADNAANDYYIFIDDIDRGDVGKIFGDVLSLIKIENRGEKLKLPFSGDEFYVPSNVYIIATMNSCDDGINKLDSYVKRRFSMLKCNVDYDIISDYIEDSGVSPKMILEIINKRLECTENCKKVIGHGFFMANGKQINSVSELKDIFFYEIVPTIYNYCSNDYKKVKEILGECMLRLESKDVFEIEDDEFIEEIKSEFGENRIYD